MVLGTPSLVHAGIDGVLATGSSVLGVGRQGGGGVVERSSRGGRRGRGRSQRHSSAGGQVQRRRGRGSSQQCGCGCVVCGVCELRYGEAEVETRRGGCGWLWNVGDAGGDNGSPDRRSCWTRTSAGGRKSAKRRQDRVKEPARRPMAAALLGVPTDHVSRLTSHISRWPVSLGQAMTCIQDRLHHHTLTPDHEPRVVWGPDGHALSAAYSRPANSPCNPHKDTASGTPR
jgi:hypothetical protein